MVWPLAAVAAGAFAKKTYDRSSGSGKDFLKKGLGSVGGALLGKSKQVWNEMDPDLKRSAEAGRVAQRLGLQKFTDLSNAPVGDIVSNQIASEKRGVTGGVQDTIRRIQDLRAQRGLGTSSVGLGQITGAQRQATEKLGMIEGTRAQRLRDLRRQQAQDLLGASGNVLGSRGAALTQSTITNQGMLPAITAAIGGAFGGPAGATAGYGAGKGVTGAFGPGERRPSY